LLREAFRLQQHDLPAGLDLVLVPRQGGDPTLEDLKRSLLELSNKLDVRVAE